MYEGKKNDFDGIDDHTDQSQYAEGEVCSVGETNLSNVVSEEGEYHDACAEDGIGSTVEHFVYFLN